MAVVDASGTAVGPATVTAAVGIIAAVGALALGTSTTSGDTAWWGAGTASGQGELLPADPSRRRDVSGVIMGTSATFGQVGIVHLASATANGQGELLYDNQQEASGTSTGQATTTAEAVILRVAGGTAKGTSALLISIPDVIQGSSYMTGFVIVERPLPPVRAVLPPTKQFRYGHRFQRGDLSIYLCDLGGPVLPAHISYTLYQFRSDGSRFRVGPRDRQPVPGTCGEFYVTGTAGECGQPGCWAVEWKIQRNGLAPVQVKMMEFMVVDAVLAACPCDTTPRVKKYGWS